MTFKDLTILLLFDFLIMVGAAISIVTWMTGDPTLQVCTGFCGICFGIQAISFMMVYQQEKK